MAQPSYIPFTKMARKIWAAAARLLGWSQITNFPSDVIQLFEYSPDGKTPGVRRARTESDAVLLHDTGAAEK